jgi:hypothetical protein
MDRGKKQTWPPIFAIFLLVCTILVTIVAFTGPAETRIVLYSSVCVDDDYCVAVIWNRLPHGGITFRIRKGPVSTFVYQKIGEICGDRLEP